MDIYQLFFDLISFQNIKLFSKHIDFVLKMNTFLKRFKRLLPLPTRQDICTHEKIFKISLKPWLQTHTNEHSFVISK